MTDRRAALTYSSYLALDEVLAAQRPRTAEHDELLFVVIHQVYELWSAALARGRAPAGPLRGRR
jgi:tryptophan 2,3-dioxygenase